MFGPTSYEVGLNNERYIFHVGGLLICRNTTGVGVLWEKLAGKFLWKE